MILSKKDLKEYLEADKRAGRRQGRCKFTDVTRKYTIILRKCEYHTNMYRKNKKVLHYIPMYYYNFKKFVLSTITGIQIGNNVCDKGLNIAHVGPIIINSHARIGQNCRIHICVNIGTKAGENHEAPVIGNNVYIAPGVKMFGKIEIADNIAIGANAVVNKSFLEPGVTIAGIPAKVISNKGSSGLLVPCDDK